MGIMLWYVSARVTARRGITLCGTQSMPMHCWAIWGQSKKRLDSCQHGHERMISFAPVPRLKHKLALQAIARRMYISLKESMADQLLWILRAHLASNQLGFWIQCIIPLLF